MSNRETARQECNDADPPCQKWQGRRAIIEAELVGAYDWVETEELDEMIPVASAHHCRHDVEIDDSCLNQTGDQSSKK